MDMDKEIESKWTSDEGGCKSRVTLVDSVEMPRYQDACPEHSVGHLLLVLTGEFAKGSDDFKVGDFMCTVQVIGDGYGRFLVNPFTCGEFLRKFGMDGVRRICRAVKLLGTDKLEGGVEIVL